MKNKRIFITGGAGYLGKNLIERLYNDNEIVCYSRDEAKHYLLKKKYPKIKCVVGDIRNLNRLIILVILSKTITRTESKVLTTVLSKRSDAFLTEAHEVSNKAKSINLILVS